MEVANNHITYTLGCHSEKISRLANQINLGRENATAWLILSAPSLGAWISRCIHRSNAIANANVTQIGPWL